ncbi:MAG: phage holin family protein [Solirubrobacterales bacterium]
MKNWLIRWGINIAALYLIAYLLQPNFHIAGWGAVFGTIVLAVVNAVIRPLIVLLTLPINILTLGLFTLVINGLSFWLTSVVVKGFDINSFWTAILAALMLSVISTVAGWFFKD